MCYSREIERDRVGPLNVTDAYLKQKKRVSVTKVRFTRERIDKQGGGNTARSKKCTCTVHTGMKQGNLSAAIAEISGTTKSRLSTELRLINSDEMKCHVAYLHKLMQRTVPGNI